MLKKMKRNNYESSRDGRRRKGYRERDVLKEL